MMQGWIHHLARHTMACFLTSDGIINGIMTQLTIIHTKSRTKLGIMQGWIHHLARHAVACFLTRGDLWVSWEEGLKVFDELLLDADW